MMVSMLGSVKAFQNDNVSDHSPGVNLAANTPVIIAIVNHEANANTIPSLQGDVIALPSFQISHV